MPLLFRLMKQAQFVPACGAAQGALGIFPFQQVFDKFDALSYNRAQSSFPRKAASLLFFLSLAIGFAHRRVEMALTTWINSPVIGRYASAYPSPK